MMDEREQAKILGLLDLANETLDKALRAAESPYSQDVSPYISDALELVKRVARHMGFDPKDW